MATAYEIAHRQYRELAKKSAQGDAAAKAEKAKVMEEIRTIERDAARAGTTLNAVYKGDNVEVSSAEGDSKKSLQQEYIRKFDDEKKVNVGGEEQTLQQYHKKRLLGR